MSKYLFYKMIGIITFCFSFYLLFYTSIGDFTELDILKSINWNQIKDVRDDEFHTTISFTFFITLYLIRIIIVFSIFQRLKPSVKIVFIFVLILNFITNSLLWSLRIEGRAIGKIYIPLILLIFVWIILSFKFTKEE